MKGGGHENFKARWEKPQKKELWVTGLCVGVGTENFRKESRFSLQILENKHHIYYS